MSIGSKTVKTTRINKDTWIKAKQMERTNHHHGSSESALIVLPYEYFGFELLMR